MKAEDWVSTENGFKLRKPAKNQDTANTDDQKAATAALPDEEMLSETDGFSGDQTESSETAVAETDTTAVTAEVTAMETPAATDTVSVTNEEFYTVADGIVKVSTEYKGETHTGYYLFDEEGILVTGQAEVKEKSSADEESDIRCQLTQQEKMPQGKKQKPRQISPILQLQMRLLFIPDVKEKR